MVFHRPVKIKDSWDEAGKFQKKEILKNLSNNINMTSKTVFDFAPPCVNSCLLIDFTCNHSTS